MTKPAAPTSALLPAAILDRAIDGANLSKSTLRDELGASATHVVFLRHFG
jgi:hypothetical protein